MLVPPSLLLVALIVVCGSLTSQLYFPLLILFYVLISSIVWMWVSECTLHVTVSGSVPSRVMSGDALGQSRAAGQVCFAGQLASLSQSGWKNHYFYTLRCISWWLKATEPSLSDTVFPPKTPSREWPQQVSVLLSAVCPTLCILFLPASLSAHTLVAYLCHSLTVWMFPVNLMNYMNKQILLSICPYFIECKASFS